MTRTTDKTAAALKQAEKFRALQEEIEKGMQDVKAGCVREWDFEDFRRRARIAPRQRGRA